MLSELLGKYQYETDEGTTKVRELLTPQEVFQLEQILLLNANNMPLLLEPAPYFENKTLLKRTQMPKLQIQNTWNLQPPEMLKFN